MVTATASKTNRCESRYLLSINCFTINLNWIWQDVLPHFALIVSWNLLERNYMIHFFKFSVKCRLELTLTDADGIFADWSSSGPSVYIRWEIAHCCCYFYYRLYNNWRKCARCDWSIPIDHYTSKPHGKCSYYIKAIYRTFLFFIGLMNPLGYWNNARKVCKSLAFGSRLTIPSRVLSTSAWFIEPMFGILINWARHLIAPHGLLYHASLVRLFYVLGYHHFFHLI